MSGINEFLVFDENNQNSLTNEAYSIDEQRLNGVESGIARSSLYNKAMRQATLLSNAFGQLLSEKDLNAKEDSTIKEAIKELFNIKNISSDNEEISLNDVIKNNILINSVNALNQSVDDNFYNYLVESDDKNLGLFGQIVAKYILDNSALEETSYSLENIKNCKSYKDLDSNCVNEVKNAYENFEEFNKLALVFSLMFPFVKNPLDVQDYNSAESSEVKQWNHSYLYVVDSNIEYDSTALFDNSTSYGSVLAYPGKGSVDNYDQMAKKDLIVKKSGFYFIRNGAYISTYTETTRLYAYIYINDELVYPIDSNLSPNDLYGISYWLNEGDKVTLAYANPYSSSRGLYYRYGIELCTFCGINSNLDNQTLIKGNDYNNIQKQYCILFAKFIHDFGSKPFGDKFIAFSDGEVRISGTVFAYCHSNNYNMSFNVGIFKNNTMIKDISHNIKYGSSTSEYEVVDITLKVKKGDVVYADIIGDFSTDYKTNLFLKSFIILQIENESSYNI